MNAVDAEHRVAASRPRGASYQRSFPWGPYEFWEGGVPVMFPPTERALIAEHYGAAEVVLEYGSGGSTALAASFPGLRTFSVESDKEWLRAVRRWLKRFRPDARVTMHHGDVGPTRTLGYPEKRTPSWRWPRYALSVWEREDFEAPDVVFVDGRFRVACALAAVLLSRKPVTVIFDDYEGREHYRAIERYGAPERRVGRMAVFRFEPRAPGAADLRLLAAVLQDPR